jgi:hypothetical protein
LVPWLNHILGPAGPNKLTWTESFASPVYDVAFNILHVEINLGMRIAHSNSVTVPFKVTGFFSSYAALPWCGYIGPQTIRAPTTIAADATNLLLKQHLQDDFNPKFLNRLIHPTENNLKYHRPKLYSSVYRTNAPITASNI